MKIAKQEVAIFTLVVFIICLLIWAFFQWLTPEYPLDQKEMTAIVGIVGIIAFFVKRWQSKKNRS
ncbi:MAG: hypothetical protein DWQ10_15185 [Calditrichaeota bacterium]|nr:MAG: hypothetical protein DWQ10_15185 [Calditrichota bacterium]